ncbi:MAG TPA: SIMPL domain-containing protein [Nocardioidaceae bacterium]|nr:SIMPL domain-containing protein [Nocardioidaceae bacterium]
MDATVSTVGHGSASGTPDTMRLRVAVGTTDRSVRAALAGVAAGVRRLGEVAREHTTEDRITTRNLNVWPQHEQDDTVHYRASQSIDVHCGSFDAAGALVVQLAEALGDGLEIHGVQPLLGDTEALAQTARARAFEDARGKAEELAGLAGRTLADVVSVREDAGGVGPMEAGAELVSARSMPFEPGSASVTASLTVTWLMR